jgi:hypothetical protein
MTVLPKPPPDQKPKETVLSYYLNEPELASPQIKYSKEYSFHEITGSLNLTVKEYLVTASWNSSADAFVNCSNVSIHSTDTRLSIFYEMVGIYVLLIHVGLGFRLYMTV